MGTIKEVETKAEENKKVSDALRELVFCPRAMLTGSVFSANQGGKGVARPLKRVGRQIQITSRYGSKLNQTNRSRPPSQRQALLCPPLATPNRNAAT